jgi:DHA1 family multidrug resistance protein-like MFS transporter
VNRLDGFPWAVNGEGAIYAIGFLVYVAIGTVVPLVPEFHRDLGTSIAEVSLIVSAFGLARLCVDLPVASLAVRVGFRGLLGAGTAFLAVAYAGSAAASGVLGLVLGQMVAGIGSALCHVTSLSLLGARSTPERSGRTMGHYFVATFSGLTVAGPLSGFVAARVGWRASLLVAAGAAALALGLVVLLPLPTGNAIGVGPRPAKAPAWRTVLRPHLLTVYLLHFTALFLWAGVRGTLWPTLASTHARLSVDTIGTTLGLGSLLSLGALHLAGILGDRHGKRPVIAFGLVASAVGIGLLAMPNRPVVLFASLAFQDLGQGFLAANASALLADVLRGPGIGLATGVMRLTADVGWLVGPLALGGLAGGLGYGVATAVAVAVPLANLVLLKAARGERKAPCTWSA